MWRKMTGIGAQVTRPTFCRKAGLDLRDFYDSALSRILGFLFVAVPVALIVGGVIAFRASGAVAQGTPGWIAVLAAGASFAAAFGGWRLFVQGMSARRSRFTPVTNRTSSDGLGERPPTEQALQPGATEVGIESQGNRRAG